MLDPEFSHCDLRVRFALEVFGEPLQPSDVAIIMIVVIIFIVALLAVSFFYYRHKKLHYD